MYVSIVLYDNSVKYTCMYTIFSQEFNTVDREIFVVKKFSLVTYRRKLNAKYFNMKISQDEYLEYSSAPPQV